MIFGNAAKISVTFFTRPGCSLCVTAKNVLNEVKKSTCFGFTEIDQILQLRQTTYLSLPESTIPRIVRLDNADLSDLIALDAEAFGAPRADVLTNFYRRDPEQFLISRDSTEIHSWAQAQYQ